ncbi:Sec-independent protein translocase protein TatB [Halomonas sp. NO4]|uniref:Sec-independent protein translocase protein TatB n=1 Tax=Halomonas sp. NO4 TaxID=2484813 RepID=UPI0013D0847E|nr:Sec-independent protein translocase protein TatB [Halomonas sp. NO4]
MFDIGFLELLLLGVVGLLVLGPERLPKAARTLGLWIGKVKRTVSGMQKEINAQLEAEELRQKLKEQQTKLDKSLGKAKRDVERLAEEETPPRQRDAPASGADAETPKPASARLDDALASVKDDTVKDDTASADDKRDAASR